MAINVTNKTLEALKDLRAVNVESDLVRLVAEHFDVPVEDALRLYYESELSEAIASNRHGEQYLDASYLFEEFIKQARL